MSLVDRLVSEAKLQDRWVWQDNLEYSFRRANLRDLLFEAAGELRRLNEQAKENAE